MILIMQDKYPDSKVHGANMVPIWDQQDPGGPRVGPIYFAIWVGLVSMGIDFKDPCLVSPWEIWKYSFQTHYTES